MADKKKVGSLIADELAQSANTKAGSLIGSALNNAANTKAGSLVGSAIANMGNNQNQVGSLIGSALNDLAKNSNNADTKKPTGTKPSGGGSKTGSGSGTGTAAAGASAGSSNVIGGTNLVSSPAAGRQQTGPYTESQRVTDAYKALQAAQQGQPGEYQYSPEVLAAQQALGQITANRPASYQSKYGQALDDLLQQIQNPGKFKYEFNGDNLFKQYADMYTQRGKQASLDAQGQAAALNGGYGSSYGQMVGNQAYDQNLTELYDRGMDLYDRAYQRWLDEQQNRLNAFNATGSMEDRAYSQYRDTVGDWENDRNFAANRYDTERNFDYGQYRDQVSDWQNGRDFAASRYDTERNFDYGQYQDAVNLAEQQYQYDASLAENQRQFNETLNWNSMTDQQKYYAEYVNAILANGQMPSAEMLKAAGLSEADAKKLLAQLGGGGGSKKVYKIDKLGNVYYEDSKGNVINVPSSQVTSDMLVQKSNDLKGQNQLTQDFYQMLKKLGNKKD